MAQKAAWDFVGLQMGFGHGTIELKCSLKDSQKSIKIPRSRTKVKLVVYFGYYLNNVMAWAYDDDRH